MCKLPDFVGSKGIAKSGLFTCVNHGIVNVKQDIQPKSHFDSGCMDQ